MKSIKLGTVKTGVCIFGAVLMAAPVMTSAGASQRLDIHGWAIDEAPSAQAYVGTSMSVAGPRLDIHGWAIDEADAPTNQGYKGTSLTAAGENGLGFSDPKAGQGDYEASSYVGTSLSLEAEGELGFTDPRPGE